jgi:hypothetical protein
MRCVHRRWGIEAIHYPLPALARGRRLSPRLRIALVAGLATLTGVLAVAGRPFDTPIRRVANYRPDPPGPIWNTPIDAAAIEKAARIIPRNGVYLLVDSAPPSAGNPETTLHHDLLGAAYLHLLPAVPALSLADAGWAIVYKQPVPNGPIARRWQLGPGIVLVKLGRA